MSGEPRRDDRPDGEPASEAAGRVLRAIFRIHKADGVVGISKMPDNWRRDIDGAWAMEVNGSKETRNDVPPFHIAFTFNGWPAGLLSPAGDGQAMIAHGAAANVWTLADALEEECNRIGAPELEAPEAEPAPEPPAGRQGELELVGKSKP